MVPLDRDDALSTFTSSSYTPPLHRRPILAAIPSKAKSSLSMTSTDTSLNSRSSSAASSDTPRRRRKNNVLRPLNVTDSGFASDRTWSSRESIRPVETPFTPVTSILPRLSLRSIILSDDSGCSTYYRESDSCESRAPSPALSSGKIRFNVCKCVKGVLSLKLWCKCFCFIKPIMCDLKHLPNFRPSLALNTQKKFFLHFPISLWRHGLFNRG